ncbi:MAG: serine/threonine-protein kinase [Myxococcota bacterium]
MIEGRASNVKNFPSTAWLARLGDDNFWGTAQTLRSRGMGNGSQFGKYELLEPVGAGGMAEVYKARLPGAHGLDKIVAIKRILSYYCEDRSFVQMFLDEAKITLALNHPNIGQVYEVNQVDEAYFIAMEYIDGPNLSVVLKKLRRAGYRMPLDLAVYIMTQVCSGLYAAHTQCDHSGNPMYIIHRDVSPHNVLVGQRGAVKLIDFGIAKAKDRLVQTQHGAVRGKLLYLSPEQASRGELDARTDIFSAGMMLLTLINGVHIWRGKDEVEVLVELRNWSLPDLQAMRPQIPDNAHRRLRNILSRAMATAPGDRYPDAESFRIELQQLLTQLNPVFSPVSLGRFVTDVMEGRFDEAEHHPGFSTSRSGRDPFGSNSHPQVNPTPQQQASSVHENTSGGTLTAISGPQLAGVRLKTDQTPSGLYTPAPERLTPSGRPHAPDPHTEDTQIQVLTSADPHPPTSRGPWIILAVLVGVMLMLMGVVAVLVLTPAPSGTLVVHSVPPGATIELDGEKMAPITPARIERVTPGEHTVVLSLQAGRSQHTVTVQDGVQLVVVGHLDPNTPKGHTTPSGGTPSQEDSPSMEEDYATVAVITNVSGAKVSIDGHPLLDVTGREPQREPLEVTGLQMGRTYEVTIERQGYETARKDLTIDGPRVTVNLILKRKAGQ